MQWSTYGGKEGIWRLIRTLDLCHLRGSVFCNARSAELYPDAIKQIVKSGHLVEGHGYSQDQYLLEMTPEVQKATIAKSLDILAKAAGERPQGWVTSVYGWNEHTTDFLVQEGIAYYADAHGLQHAAPREDRERRDRRAAVVGVRRQPRAAREPARLLRRLQGHASSISMPTSRPASCISASTPISAAGRW